MSDRPLRSARDLDPTGRARALEAYAEAGGNAGDETERLIVETLSGHAPALLPLALSDPTLPRDLAAVPLSLPQTRAALDRALEGDDDDLLARLRRVRHRGVCRIALREVLRLADVRTTAKEMTVLAEAIIDSALAGASRAEFERHGRAIDAAGEEVPLTVLGMGKLGGQELNLGSDVDLICFYETDDAEVEGGDLTVHELFTRIVRRTARLVSDVTEDGFCFRVDLRLRPEGSQGPLVNSLASAERYYVSFGRTWERAALLRARPIAGSLRFGRVLLDALRPWVYRREVSPAVATAMEEMLLRSRRELSDDEAVDVKLGPGGIREAEFFVQSLQLIWGGLDPTLQVEGTLPALERLRAQGRVSDREAERLADAWTLLRRVEHRIHVWAGYQTHTLPPPGTDRDAFAQSLGYGNGAALEADLATAQGHVAELFASLRPEDEARVDHRFDGLLDLVADGADLEALIAAVERTDLFPGDPDEAATHLRRMARHARDPLGPVTWEKAPNLGRLLMAEVTEAADPAQALRYLAEFLTRLVGKWSYERMLLDHPQLTRRLVGLFGSSRSLSSGLIGHPEDIDRILSTQEPPDALAIREAHREVVDGLNADPDPEYVVGELRRLKRLFSLEVGLAQASRELSLAEVCDRLSELAEGQVRVSLEAAQRWAERRWGRARGASMVVVALGKLGGRELGFGGDLDLVFLYDQNGETEPTETGRSTTHAELFTRVAQRTMRFLQQDDRQGPGYDTDTRLRPSGSQGTLVVSLAAFDRYHAGKAEAWERQALLRARPIAGDEAVARMIAERVGHVAYDPAGAPAPDVLAETRRRLEEELAHETPRRFHPKVGHGGLVDIEFLTQFLQMRAGDELRVRTPHTLHALRRLAEAGRLDREDASMLEDSYRFLRRVEQALRLYDERRDLLLEPDGRSGAFVARHLGLRARDGQSRAEALRAAYLQHTRETRGRFERLVAPVAAKPPA